MIHQVDKNNNYIIVTEEETFNNEKAHNLYLIGVNEGGIYIEYAKSAYKAKENIEKIGSFKNGIFMENCIEEGSPLIGTFSNGLDFHYSKIVSITKERRDLRLN